MRKTSYFFIVIMMIICFSIMRNQPIAFGNEFSNFYWEQMPQKTKIVLEAKSAISYEVITDPKSLDYTLLIKELDLSNLPRELVIDTEQVKVIKFFKEGDAYYLTIQRASLFPCNIQEANGKLQILVEGIDNKEAIQAPKDEISNGLNAPADNSVAKQNEKIVPEQKPTEILDKATMLKDVSYSNEEGKEVIVFKADGKVQYNTFTLHNPERIVVDFYNVVCKSSELQKSVNSELINKIRVAQFQTTPSKIVRAVIDVKIQTNYKVVDRGNLLVLGIPEYNEVISEISTDESKINQAKQMETSNKEEAKEIVPVVETKQIDISEEKVNNELVNASPKEFANNDKILFSNEEEEKTKKDQVISTLKAHTIVTEEKKYQGEIFTFDFTDIDIKDLFKFIADISGLNIILDPKVSGKITLKLVDVPWDQALDLICKSQGLGYAIEGNVIRIAPLSVLAKEAEERRKQKEQEELVRPMRTIIRPLSYATSSEVAGLVRKMLSPKGTIDEDSRTNTLIITDIDTKIPAIESLIDSLDLRIPQVIIEARMVETTREFFQGIGIQWGFRGIMSPAYGTNTSLIFPNSLYLYGDNIVSTKGGIGGNPLGGYAVNLPTAQAPNAAILLSAGNKLDTFRLDLALSALENQGQGRILSNPKIATQNNKQAEIRQGYQIPVQTIANNTVTTTYVNATLSLQVKPQITAEDTIIMDVTVENNRPDFTNLVYATPPIITQKAKTTILMDNGSTAVLGGILVGRDEIAQSGIPLLSHLPIVKYLFKNKNITRENRELLIFLTPRIIK